MKRRFMGFLCTGIAVCFSISLVACSDQSDTAGEQAAARSTDAAESLRIVPHPARANNILEANFEADPFADPSDYKLKWKRNGEVIAGETSDTLAPEHFRKGDEVSVEVAHEGAEVQQASVVIDNSPPKILSASTFMGVRDKPEIYVHLKSTDVDKDEISYAYRWFRNDRLIDEQTAATLDPLLVERGDRIYAEVIALDGQYSSTPFKSDPITVENHAPRISSKPVPPTAEDDAFHYKVLAEDLDADNLTYQLVSAPPGMSIDSDGNVSWVFPPRGERVGQHEIEVKVSDPQGGVAVQKFRLTFEMRAETQ